MNFALDFFLVFGPPQMGVAGAAIATTVSQYISLGVLLWMLVKSGRLIPADLFELPPREDITLFLKVRVDCWGSRSIFTDLRAGLRNVHGINKYRQTSLGRRCAQRLPLLLRRIAVDGLHMSALNPG